MPFLFEKLNVYQKAVDFADRIGALTDSFPRGSYYLADQLRRASVSIPANIAEGNGRWHAGDRKSFFYIARGSACECVPLLELCQRRGLVPEDQHRSLIRQIEEANKMLTSLAAGASNRRDSRAIEQSRVEQ